MSEAPSGHPAVNIGISIALVVASALFVGGEYALVAMRRGRIEPLARKGNKSAKRLLRILDDMSPFIAGTQVGITIVGIAMGTITEPFVAYHLGQLFSFLDPALVSFCSFIIVLFALVVLGELVPKYIALKKPEQFMFMAYRPLDVFISVCKPIISLATFTSQLILKPMGINVKDTGKETIERDELLTILQMTSTDGVLEKEHANMVTRALRLDMLAARDVMVHRLDIQWLDIDLGLSISKRQMKVRPILR